MENVHALNDNPGRDDMKSEVSGSKKLMDSSLENSDKGLNICFTLLYVDYSDHFKSFESADICCGEI